MTNLSGSGDFYIRAFYTKSADAQAYVPTLTVDGETFMTADDEAFMARSY